METYFSPPVKRDDLPAPADNSTAACHKLCCSSAAEEKKKNPFHPVSLSFFSGALSTGCCCRCLIAFFSPFPPCQQLRACVYFVRMSVVRGLKLSRLSLFSIAVIPVRLWTERASGGWNAGRWNEGRHGRWANYSAGADRVPGGEWSHQRPVGKKEGLPRSKGAGSYGLWERRSLGNGEKE